MKSLLLISFSLITLFTNAQKEILIDAKNKDDKEVIKAIKELEKGAEITFKDKKGNSVDVIVKKVNSEPSAKDIRELTPRLERAIDSLEKYNDDKEKLKFYMESDEVKKIEIKKLKSEKISLNKSVGKKDQKISELETDISSKRKIIINQKNHCINEIDKAIKLRINEFPEYYLKSLKISAQNLGVKTSNINLLQGYIDYHHKLTTAKKLLASQYNSQKIKSTTNELSIIKSDKYPGLNKDNLEISRTLSNYCKYNNSLLKDIESAKKIPDLKIRKDNIKNKYSYKKVFEYNYEYLMKQAKTFINSGNYTLTQINCN